ncbi:MAG: SDR family NAD(P)-dependent oxidoreductase, partial [Pseudomonadota bacterium]
MTRLAHHRAVVTGAGAGIGRAVARRLAAEGAKVVAQDLDEAAAKAVADEIGGIAVQGDVAVESDVDRAFAACEEAWGPATLAVNNAGIVLQSRLSDMAVQDFDRMIAVHLRGCFLCCRRALGPMLAAKSGAIVNVASQLGQIGGVELT